MVFLGNLSTKRKSSYVVFPTVRSCHALTHRSPPSTSLSTLSKSSGKGSEGAAPSNQGDVPDSEAVGESTEQQEEEVWRGRVSTRGSAVGTSHRYLLLIV